MNENEQYYQLLLQRFVSQAATEEEAAILLHELGEAEIDQALESYLAADAAEYLRQHPLRPKNPAKRVKLRTLLPAAVAASLLLFVAAAYYFHSLHPGKAKGSAELVQNNIPPGSSKAILISDDGNSVLLDPRQKGIVFHTTQSTVKVEHGRIVIANQNTGSGKAEARNYTIRTPRGGQYEMILPDGTKVQLNAASEIRFPSVFTGGERKVFLKGEAYFDVVHEAGNPFKVQTGTLSITDIGTAFNVSVYEDDKLDAVTLVEGSVRLSDLDHRQAAVLKPGQQARFTKDGLQVSKVDIDQAIGWKENKFVFGDNSIESVMRQVARWYDVDVVYEGEKTKETFVGVISRQNNISEILRMLEATHVVEFSIKGRTVIVSSVNNR
jgi:transmembrane sensor